MTALVIPPAQILGWTPAMLAYAHRRVAGTSNGYVWHRRTHTTICAACRTAYNQRQNRNRRDHEHQRLLDAGVNPATARYLARVIRRRVSTAASTGVHSAPIGSAA